MADDVFYYYAYGSNLLKKRIRINNPSAEFIDIGRLDEHQLDFMKYSKHWGGTSATIVPKENSFVWGAVWKIHKNDLPALDKQEGVDTNWYFAKDVNVVSPKGVKYQCRVYQQTISPNDGADLHEIPLDRRPSSTYLEVILQGAIECNLPESYIQKLKQIPDNGKTACPEMLEKLKK